MYALTSILVFLPNKTNLKQISVDEDEEEITKIEENNILKEEYHNKKISKSEIIIVLDNGIRGLIRLLKEFKYVD